MSLGSYLFISARISTSYVRPQEDVKLESYQDDTLRGRESPRPSVLHETSSARSPLECPTLTLSLPAKHWTTTEHEGYNVSKSVNGDDRI